MKRKDNTCKQRKLLVRFLLAVLSAFLISGFIYSVAEAHKTVQVEQYEIEVGWDVEPPVVGFRNAIVYEISESPSEGLKTGVISAFKNLESTVQMGGVTKVLDIKSKMGGIDSSTGEISTQAAYNFGVFGLSLGAAGVILAIIAMIKRK